MFSLRDDSDGRHANVPIETGEHDKEHHQLSSLADVSQYYWSSQAEELSENMKGKLSIG
jgi:hypothetical protein